MSAVAVLIRRAPLVVSNISGYRSFHSNDVDLWFASPPRCGGGSPSPCRRLTFSPRLLWLLLLLLLLRFLWSS